jgi:CHAT domain-containing protein
LIGFAWAFLQAGAGNVVAGIWDVDDAATSKLMDGLYAGLARGEAPAAALRRAKLGLLRSGTMWRKPFFWAPFEVFTRYAAT